MPVSTRNNQYPSNLDLFNAINKRVKKALKSPDRLQSILELYMRYHYEIDALNYQFLEDLITRDEYNKEKERLKDVQKATIFANLSFVNSTMNPHVSVSTYKDYIFMSVVEVIKSQDLINALVPPTTFLVTVDNVHKFSELIKKLKKKFPTTTSEFTRFKKKLTFHVKIGIKLPTSSSTSEINDHVQEVEYDD